MGFDKDIETYEKDDLIYVKGTDKLYARSEEVFYRNGNLQSSGKFENGYMKGICKHFNEHGKVYSKMTFVLDISNGLHETFYESENPFQKVVPKM